MNEKLKRTVPVPPGHCPEPMVEIGMLGYCPMRVRWQRPKHWSWPKNGGTSYAAKHSCGGSRWEETKYGGARMLREYGDIILENVSELRLPWKLAPLDGKYYGTIILDRDGEEVATFWDHTDAAHPSVREKASFGDWTEEKWAEYVCDSHWESERDYVRALAIVEAMNATEAARPRKRK